LRRFSGVALRVRPLITVHSSNCIVVAHDQPLTTNAQRELPGGVSERNDQIAQ
jgi:hypothetical protein